MRRGEIWTAAGGKNYAKKPRPVIIVQSDFFRATGSVTVCPLTADPAVLPLFRIAIDATEATGLQQQSRLMVDKVTTIPRSKLDRRIGSASPGVMDDFARALVAFFAIA